MRKFYTFPIGDWSCDGHEKFREFTVSGDKDFKKVTAAHYKCEKVLGFKIRDICGEYEEREISREIQDKIIAANIRYADPECDEESDIWHVFEDMWTDQLVALWVDILNHIDPSLNLKLEAGLPSMKDCPGYGLFE